jgi:hypothetical protein
MPETATPTKVESPAAPKAPAAPEAPTPELAPDAGVRAVVESFRHAGTSGVAGAAASAGAGGVAQPSEHRRTPRPDVRARDLVALQRMAGNRAVSALIARRPVVPTVLQRQSVPTLPPPAEKAEPKPTDKDAAEQVEEKEARALIVVADSSARAAHHLGEVTKKFKRKDGTPMDIVMFGLEQTSMDVYDREGTHILGPLELTLPKGVSFDEGIFVAPGDGGASRRLRMNPDSGKVEMYEEAAFLKDLEPSTAKDGSGKEASAAKGAKLAKPPKGTKGQDVGDISTPASNAPKTLDLRKYMKNPKALDDLAARHKGAAEIYFVRTPLSGERTGNKGKAGPRSTGFAGELEGHGPPPNAPPWPVTIEGPEMVPLGGDALFAANINWAANGSDLLSMVTSQIGTYIHYRWEMYDVTAFAKAKKQKTVDQANALKAAIAADQKKPDAAAGGTGGPAAGGKGGAGADAKPATTGTDKGAASQTLATDAIFGSDEKIDKSDQTALRQGKHGAGTDVTGMGEADENYRRSWRHLGKDTKQAWADIGASGDTFFERRANDVANVSSLAMLPASVLVTAVGSTLRWIGDAFAGERQQQGVPMRKEGTYLVRVITPPAVQQGRNGENVIRPSSVASSVFEVVPMERMVKEGLDAPGAQLDKLKKDLKDAKDAKQDTKKLEADIKAFELRTTGDPLEMLEAQITAKQAEVDAAQASYEKTHVHGQLVRLQQELSALEKTKKVYKLQEEKRIEGGGLGKPTRVNAVLASEVTGQPYPLVLSVGPMATVGNVHHWKVLDATSKNAEGFEGIGATPSAALKSALDKFAGDESYGPGTIGVRIPDSVPLEEGARREFRLDSAPRNFAIARSRIDDLVATLVALGLIVASAGTAAAVIGAGVAAARLINRWMNGKLYLTDPETLNDFLAILGGIGVGATKLVERSARAAATIQVRQIGGKTFAALAGEVQEAKIAEAAAAIMAASKLAQGVEKANEILNYAGLIWGNVEFLDTMADIAIREANNEITHAEARRLRTTAIGGAVQNNGLFIAGNMKKGAEQRKKAGKTTESKPGASSPESPVTTGESKPGGVAKPGEVVKPGEGPKPVEHGLPGEPGKPAETKPTETKPTEAKPGEGKPTEADGASGGPKHAGGPEQPAEKGATGGPVEEHTATGGAKMPEREAPKPGSAEERTAAIKALQDAAAGAHDAKTTPANLKAAAENAIGKAGAWKEGLKKALSKMAPAERLKAEQALVEARDDIVNGEWNKIKDKYPGLWMENAGTKSFGSDIDATIRPVEEASGPGKQMADQVEQAAKAAAELSEALRRKVNGETDAVIDTNIYSFIGEGRVKPVDAAGKAVQGHVDIMVGLAEQMRGQSDAQFNAFEKGLAARAGDPTVADAAKKIIGEAKTFHDNRQAEWKKALADAGTKANAKPTPEQSRKAREALLNEKKARLGDLMKGEPPNYRQIAEKQAEINWFAPDAYATPSAFKQAVAHGQRLKGTAKATSEWTGGDIATKLRERAGRLPESDPRAQKLRADANRAESQQRLLDMTLKELSSAREQELAEREHGPSAAGARVQELEARADGLREAIHRTAERTLIAEILDITNPADQPGPERLTQSAAASGANVGMLEDHVKHATDIDGKVKAAAKYAARIAMAEFLSGLKPSSDRIARLLGEFVKSRWGIFEAESPQILRDMFLKYAEMTGRTKDIVHDEKGVPVGVTDDLKQAFVTEASEWARTTNEGIQVAAIAQKVATEPAMAGGGGAPTGPDGAKPAAGATTATQPAQETPQPVKPVTEVPGASGTPAAATEQVPGSQAGPSAGGGSSGGGPGGGSPGGGSGSGGSGGREPLPQGLPDRITTIRKKLADLRQQRGQARDAEQRLKALDEMLARPNLRVRDVEMVADHYEESLVGPAPVRDTPLVYLDPRKPGVRVSLENALQKIGAGDPRAEEYVSIIMEAYGKLHSLAIGKSTKKTDKKRQANSEQLRARFLAELDTGLLNKRAADIFLDRIQASRRGPGGEAGAVARGELVWVERASGKKAPGPGPDIVTWPAEHGRVWWVDHIVEVQHGGADEPWNYLPLSEVLNREKSAAMVSWTSAHRDALLAAQRAGEDVSLPDD